MPRNALRPCRELVLSTIELGGADTNEVVHRGTLVEAGRSITNTRLVQGLLAVYRGYTLVARLFWTVDGLLALLSTKEFEAVESVAKGMVAEAHLCFTNFLQYQGNADTHELLDPVLDRLIAEHTFKAVNL